MTGFSKWKRKFSISLALILVFSSNGGVALARYSNLMSDSQIIQNRNSAALQEKGPLASLAVVNSDFEIDENNVLIKYNGTASVVDVPEGVAAIGSNAFYKALDGNGITEIHLPDSVTSLQDYAFSGCHTMPEIFLPDSVVNIGKGAFYFAKGLVNILAGEYNTSYKSVDGVLFSKDMTQLICFPEARTQTRYEIPTTVKTIDEFAFDGAVNLADVVIPQSVTTIGKFAFRDCTFCQISLPEGLANIGELAFARCKNLKSVTIPKGVSNWGRAAFFYCLGLEEVIFENGITSIGSEAFSTCEALKRAFIPETVTAIADDAFTGCPQLAIYGQAGSYAQSYAVAKNIPFIEVIQVTGVSIAESVTEALVGDTIQLAAEVSPENAMDKTVTWESSNTSVAAVNDNGLVECIGAGEVEIKVATHDGGFTAARTITVSTPQIDNPDFTIVGGLLIEYKGAGGDVVIPEGVIRVDDNAFAGNTSVKSIYFPQSVEYVGNIEDALRGCTGIVSLTFSNTTVFLNIDLNNHPNIKELNIYKGSVDSIAHNRFYPPDATENLTIENINIGEGITKIDTFAFKGYKALKQVQLPESLKIIGQEAFSGCESLQAVALPSGLETIGGYSFDGCTSLLEIVIPNGIKEFSSDAFNDCTSLAEVSIPNGLSISNAFYGCTQLNTLHITLSKYTTVLNTVYADTEVILIDEGITEIKFYAFNNLTKIRGLVLPGTVQSIEEKAFVGCTNLESITIPCQTITQTETFYNCPNIKNITVSYKDNPVVSYNLQLPASVQALTIAEGITNIQAWSFNDLHSLKTLILPDSLKEIGSDCFNGCTILENFRFSKAFEILGSDCFKDSAMLTELNIPSNSLFLGENSFQNSTGIKTLKVFFSGNTDFSLTGLSVPIEEVYIEEGVTRLFSLSLHLATVGSQSLRKIVLPDSLLEIGEGVFKNCSSLSGINIPSGVTKIGAFAFSNCSSLTSIVIPDGVTYIEGGTFYGCTGLQNVVLSRNIVGLGWEAFSGCTNITQLAIPKLFGVYLQESSLNGCFANLMKLTLLNSQSSNNIVSNYIDAEEIIIEDGFTEIESDSFQNLSKLKRVYIPSSIQTIGSGSFDNCSSIEELVFPEGLVSIEDAFKNCTSLTSVTIPGSVEYISGGINSNEYFGAFLGCTNLSTINISSASLQKIGMAFPDCLPKTINVLYSEGASEINNYRLPYADRVNIEEGITSIDAGAIKCKEVLVPKSVSSMSTALCDIWNEWTSPTTMLVYKDSYAHKFAVANNVAYTLIDGDVANDPVTGVNIIEDSKVILLGDEKMLVYAVQPATAGNKNVTWESSNPEIATVNSLGYVKGLMEGSVTITVTTEEGGFTDSCEVTIVKAPDYEKDLTYMALSAMVYHDFMASDAGKTCSQIVDENPDKEEFYNIFIKNISIGEFITAVAGDWILLTGFDFNDISGYYGAAFKNVETGEIVVASRGTESDKGIDDTIEDIKFGGIGILGEQFESCNRFYELVKNQFPEASITVTGHSLGGALASYLAQRHGLKARVFNAPSATYAVYTNDIWNVSGAFHGIDSWDIIDYTNEYCLIGNSGIGDNVTYGSGQFADFFTRYGLNDKTVYDFMDDGNIIALGGAIDKTIICTDNSKINLLEGSWNTHSLGSLVKGVKDGQKLYLEIDQRYQVKQTIPYKAESDLITSLLEEFLTRQKLLLGSSQEDTLYVDGIEYSITAFGGDKDDIIVTGINDDEIVGGEGRDYLDGGVRNDIYYFSRQTMNDDVINDPSGADKIYLTDLALDQIEIGSITDGEESYFTITDKGSGNKIYINKKRNLLSPSFTIVDTNGSTTPLAEPSIRTMMRSFSAANSVTPVIINGTSTVEIYDTNGQLLKDFSNQTTSQSYENYGYFYGFDGENPYTMIYLFNGDYKIVVKSSDMIDYTVYSLEADDTPVMEIGVSNVDLSGNKALVTSTVTSGEIPELTLEDGSQNREQLVPEVKGVNQNLALNKSQVTLEMEQTEKLFITEEISEKINWSSSNPEVAEVDQNGNITAKNTGNAVITAATENGDKAARCFVTVTALPAYKITIGLINAIGTVTLDSGTAIAKARASYNALSDSDKALVDNYQILADAEAAYEEIKAAELANESIAAAKELLPEAFIAIERNHTNLLDYLNAIDGMRETGTTLTLVSHNENVKNDGTISYTKKEVMGNVEVHINKTKGTEAVMTIAVTIPKTQNNGNGNSGSALQETAVEQIVSAAVKTGKEQANIPLSKGDVSLSSQIISQLKNSNLNLRLQHDGLELSLNPESLPEVKNGDSIYINISPVTQLDTLNAIYKMMSGESGIGTVYSVAISRVVNGGYYPIFKLNNEITLNFKLEDEDMEGIDPYSLKIYRVDEATGTLAELGGEYMEDGKSISAITSQLGKFVIMISN